MLVVWVLSKYTCIVGPSLDPRANRLGPPRGTLTHHPRCWPTPIRLQTGKFPSVARVFLQYTCEQKLFAQAQVFVIKHRILVLHSLIYFLTTCTVYTFYEVYTASRHQAKQHSRLPQMSTVVYSLLLYRPRPTPLNTDIFLYITVPVPGQNILPWMPEWLRIGTRKSLIWIQTVPVSLKVTTES